MVESQDQSKCSGEIFSDISLKSPNTTNWLENGRKYKKRPPPYRKIEKFMSHKLEVIGYKVLVRFHHFDNSPRRIQKSRQIQIPGKIGLKKRTVLLIVD